MSNRAPKRPKAPRKAKRAQETKTSFSPAAIMLGAATLVGGIAALLTFLPRLTVAISDPPDPGNPFSSSVVVTNTGYIPLDAVKPKFGIHEINGAARVTPNDQSHVGEPYISSYYPTRWGTHDLGVDDRFTFALNDSISVSKEVFGDADIAIILTYEIPLIHWKREKVFPFITKKQTNGNFYWYAEPPRN